MFDNIKETTKFGIDRLDWMAEILGILCFEEEDLKILDKNVKSTKAWLEDQIKRELTPVEYKDFLQGCLNYTKSEPASNERLSAINYLTDIDFIK